MKLSGKSKNGLGIHTSVVKKRLVDQFIRITDKPVMSMVESDDEGLIEDT